MGCSAHLILVKENDIGVMVRNFFQNMHDSIQFAFWVVKNDKPFVFGWKDTTGLERTCSQHPFLMQLWPNISTSSEMMSTTLMQQRAKNPSDLKLWRLPKVGWSGWRITLESLEVHLQFILNASFWITLGLTMTWEILNMDQCFSIWIQQPGWMEYSLILIMHEYDMIWNTLYFMAFFGVVFNSLRDLVIVQELYWQYVSNVWVNLYFIHAKINFMQAWTDLLIVCYIFWPTSINLWQYHASLLRQKQS